MCFQFRGQACHGTGNQLREQEPRPGRVIRIEHVRPLNPDPLHDPGERSHVQLVTQVGVGRSPARIERKRGKEDQGDPGIRQCVQAIASQESNRSEPVMGLDALILVDPLGDAPTSADLCAQLLEARARQAKRFGAKGPQVNGRMTPRQVRKFCPLKPEAMALLKAAMEDLGLSARAHDKVLRVAHTIADLEGSYDIKPQHNAEAIGYRSLDRTVWA